MMTDLELSKKTTTPETSEERVRFIDEHTDGFIYMVSSASITGVQSSFDEARRQYFRRIDAMNLRNPRIAGKENGQETHNSRDRSGAGRCLPTCIRRWECI